MATPQARVRIPLIALALAISVSCTLQEPASIDGLDPDPAADTLVVTPQNITVPAGDSITFIAPDETALGTPVSGPVQWTVAGGSGASISASGVFKATSSGDYTVQAIRAGKSGRSKAKVNSATATLVAVKVAPDVVTLQPGAAFTFVVSGSMSDGSIVPVTGTWAATGGTIDNAGAYRAGSTAGQFRVIVTQQGGTFADTAAVTISAAAPTLQAVEVTPNTVTLSTGGSQQFSAIGRMSDNSTSSVSVTWSATGGTITTAGRYTAGGSAGTFRVIATQQGGTRADTSAVTVTPPAPTLTAVELSPSSVNLAPGGTQQFSAIGRMSNGATAGVTVTWSATGGSVNGSGSYVAGGSAGTFRVIATQQGGTLADTSTVTIAVPPPTITLEAIEVTPSSASLLTGATQQFSAVGRMSDNSTSGVSVTWSATGGTVSSGGLYTAGGTPGTYRVIAVQQGGTKADTSSVTVSAPAPTLSAVVISPSTVSLQTSATQQFSAVGLMSDGSTSSVSVIWSETGGTITSGGLFTAGSTPGSFRVIATQQGGTRADTANVTITVPPPTLTAVEITPSSVTLTTGATQQFNAVGRMSDGSTSAVSVNWSETGGTVTSGGLYTAGSTPGTYRVIAVRQGDTKADTSTVTINAPAPTLTAVEVSPATVSLSAGATQQFTALGRMSDGSTSSVTVNWSETGGTITSGGLYTAGGTAGNFRVIAVRQGGTQADTSAVTITVAAPTLSAVEVSPATVTLAPGATQQFSALGRMSDGSTSSVSVTWSATGGSVSGSGLFTAGTTAGSTWRVIAVQQGGSLADTSTVTVTVVVPPPTGTTPNPSLLPEATGQRGVSAALYTALPVFSRSGGQVSTNPRNMAAGQFYVDPSFGTNVIRLTSSTFPASNGGAYVDYWEGGSRISYPWGAGNEWYTIKVVAGSYYLVDFNIRTYELRNQRSVPSGAGELGSAFSLDPSTPQILYTWSGSTIRKWNTATTPATEVTGGGFPKSVPGSSGYWFSMSKNDEWFVSSSGPSSTSTIYAWRRSTNTITSVTISGDYNEQKLDKSGRYVWVNRDGGIQIWDAQTGTLGPNRDFGSNSVSYQGHAGIGQGYAVGSNNSGAAPWFWRTNMASLEANPEFTSATAINPYEINNSAIWVSQAATSNQWYLATNTSGSPTYSGAKLQMAIGLVRMDASEARGVAHHYNTGSTGSYYGQYGWGNISPDGRLSAFVTNFNGGSRTDVMLVPTPTE
jgi:hypothetical protein